MNIFAGVGSWFFFRLGNGLIIGNFVYKYTQCDVTTIIL